MNANTVRTPGISPPAPRFDAKFIEEHKLVERYLEHKLPAKGARDLENWCRANPDYLNGLKLSERAQTSLQLLEASGQPLDLSEPKTPVVEDALYSHRVGGDCADQSGCVLAAVRQVLPAAIRTRGHPHPHAARIAGAAGHGGEPRGNAGPGTGSEPGAHHRQPQRAAAHRCAPRHELHEADRNFVCSSTRRIRDAH